MYTVTKKPLTPNTLWDAKKGKPLCKFTKGVLKTNDTDLVEKLKIMGYEVNGEPDPDDESTGDGLEKDLDDQNGESDKGDTKSNRRNQRAANK